MESTAINEEISGSHKEAFVGSETLAISRKRKYDSDVNHPRKKLAAGVGIDKLPDEMVLEVFSYLSYPELSQAAQVCLQWKRLALHPSLWKELVFQGDTITTDEAIYILRRCHLLEKLELLDRSDTNSILCQVGSSNNQLQSIAIRRCQGSRSSSIITAKLLIRLVKRCRNLHTVCVKESNIRSVRFYSVLGRCLPKLKRLNFSFIPRLGSKAINVIARTCNPLQELRIYRAIGKRQSVSDCIDEDVIILCKRMNSSLTVLKLNANRLTDSIVKHIGKCSNLRTLHLRYALNLTNSALVELKTLTKLESFNMTMARFISTDGWIELFSWSTLQNLTKLGLSMCSFVTDYVLECVAKTCPHLISVRLQGCLNITDDGLGKLLSGCNELRYINVYFTKYCVMRSFAFIPEFTPQLQVLRFRSYGFLEERQMVSYLRNRLPSLLIEDIDEYCIDEV